MVKFKQKKHMTSDILYEKMGNELNLGKIVSKETIQILWSGYGQLLRLTFENKTIIVKHVKLPLKSSHPRGWDSKLSHQRKINSYNVELNWYEMFSQSIDKRCLFPQGLYFYQSCEEWLIAMEDLNELGYSKSVISASKTHLNAVLKWLANFHAKFLNTKSDALWETGTYWHLDTREDELKVLKESELKTFAKDIDEHLKNSTYQTLVHGDAKLANFCFTEDGNSCAAVDFQYVGQGCAMKDVVLFMSSAVEPKECALMQKWILDTYFKHFHEAIKYYNPSLNGFEIEKEWRKLFSVAWADFLRFLKGWSPEHYKINAYSEKLSQEAIAYLKIKGKKYNV